MSKKKWNYTAPKLDNEIVLRNPMWGLSPSSKGRPL